MGSDQSPHEVVGETAPVVDSGFVEGGVGEDDVRIWAESLFGGL